MVHVSKFKHNATGKTSINQMRGPLFLLTLAMLAAAALGEASRPPTKPPVGAYHSVQRDSVMGVF
jgi:hypothetical protein